MPNYILHIGLPKTGTKYLQAHFRRHADILGPAGVHYPSNWWASKYDLNHDGLARDIIARNDARLAPIFGEFESSEYRSVLLSCEGFSDLSEDDLFYLKSLIGTAQVQVVLFCRRWSDWIPSAWQQTVKQGSNRTFPEFLTGVISEARLVPTINFRIILDVYAKVFGRESLSIVPYSNLLDESLDIVEVFYRHFLGFEQMPDITRETIHPSIGIHIAEVVRALNSLSIRAQGASDVSTFQRMEMFEDDEIIGGPLGRIVAATKESVGRVEIGDFDEPFNSLFEELTRDFGDLVRDVGCGRQLFQPRDAPGHFVHQDYMLLPGVVEDILLLHARLTSIAAAEQAAKAETAVFALLTDTSWLFDMLVMQGEAAVDYLAMHPVPDASGRDKTAFLSDFKAGTVPVGMLLEGWSSPETSATWTDGKRALLKLPLDATGGTQWMRLILRPFVAPPQLASQGFTLIINGQAVGRSRISQFAVIEVALPWALLEKVPEVIVALDLPDAARPCDLTGQTNDARQLALCVEHISIRPQSPTSSPPTIKEPLPGGAFKVERSLGRFNLTQSVPEHATGSGREGSQTDASDESEPSSLPHFSELALSDLVMRFESLGENCEFGLVQRRCDAEPLGLFRFSSAPLSRLLKALGAKFKGMGRPENLEVQLSSNGREYMVLDKRFGFLYHAWVLLGEKEPDEIALRESRRLPLLIRKLIEDITLGEKIFVYHGMDALNLAQIRELFAALRAYGPATLLWVELAEEAHAPGTVEQIEPGLLKGYMDRFAPGENAHDLSLDCWIEVCRKAYAIWKPT